MDIALPKPQIALSSDLQSKRSAKRSKAIALLLVAPLLVFLIFFFVWPVAQMLYRSVDNPILGEALHDTNKALDGWSGKEIPGEEAFSALAHDLIKARESGSDLPLVARGLNYQLTGMQTLINSTARKLTSEEVAYKPVLLKLNKNWADIKYWGVLKRESGKWTSSNLVGALDLTWGDKGSLALAPENQRLYTSLYLKTGFICLSVVVITLLLGFPLAHLIANSSARVSSLLMICVLLPFWTSLLVRTSSWLVILQTNGPLNDLLVWLHVVADNARPELAYSRTATIVAMTHILLPFMVLPLYSVMKSIPGDYQRAAVSLGAHPIRAFISVYIPQTMPGIMTGVLLVFITAIGYYITPALVGGSDGQMISNMIAYHMRSSLNWGLAGALSLIMLIVVALVLWIFNRLIGLDKLENRT